MTPSPTPTDSAEKVVAELAAVTAKEQLLGRLESYAKSRNAMGYYGPGDSFIDQGAVAAISGLLALIESQRATIERVERERDEAIKQAGDLSEGITAALGLPWIGSPTGGFRLPDDKTLISAAEARVTALEAEKAVAVADEREACAKLVEDMPIQIYRDLGIGPAGRSCKPATFDDAAERIRARQALSRSTEVKP